MKPRSFHHMEMLVGVDNLNAQLGGVPGQKGASEPLEVGINVLVGGAPGDDWRKLRVLRDWSCDGVVLSNEVPHCYLGGGEHDSQLFNICVKGPAQVNNGIADFSEGIVESYSSRSTHYNGSKPVYNTNCQVFDSDVRHLASLYVGLVATIHPVQEEVVTWIVVKREEAGYAGVPVTIKSDQEPAMIALKQAIAVGRKVETIPIESPVRESTSNARIERAIRTWQVQFRTMRHHLESRIVEKLKKDSAIIEWLIVWVADLLSKYKVHESGRATYEMNTQHIWKGKVIGLGEKVHFQFKIPANEKDTCSTEKNGIGYFN